MNYGEVVGQRATQLVAMLTIAGTVATPSQPPSGYYAVKEKPTAAQVMPARCAVAEGTVQQPARNASQDLSSAISAVAADARRDNWDGEQARAVSPETARVAHQFAALLPANLPAPEVSATPRGWMQFEWTKDDQTVFMVRVREGEKLAYAGLYADARGEEVEAIGSFPMPTKRLRETLLAELREANRPIA